TLLYQPLAGTNSTLPNGDPNRRTNLLEDVFFMTHENLSWTGIGYRVVNWNEGMGSLYRYSGTNAFNTDPALIFGRYPVRMDATNRVVDGVVHFKVRAFDANGNWIAQNLPNNTDFSKSDIRLSTDMSPSVAAGEVGQYIFYSNAIPAYVEFELGI